MLQQFGEPPGVGHVGLAARDHLHVLRVHQLQIEARAFLQHIPDRLPIRPGCLHHHRGHAFTGEPVGHRFELRRERRERPQLRTSSRARTRRTDARDDLVLADIDRGAPLNEYIHPTPPSIAPIGNGSGRAVRSRTCKACSKQQITVPGRPPASISHSGTLAPRSAELNRARHQILTTHHPAPAGRNLSPLLANIALSVLDDHFAEAWERDMAGRSQRATRRKHGHATYRLVRYADDFVVMIAGTKAHAEALKADVAAVLSTMGLRLSAEKTMIVDIDEGFEFLGFRIQRQTKRGSNHRYVYTWPARKALASIRAKVKTITKQGTNQPLSSLLRQLNGVLRGWTNYFRHGVSKDTFAVVHQYTWERVVQWLRRKHRRANWKTLRRRYLANGWWPEHEGMALFDCRTVPVTRYRYRGTRIPTPWSTTGNVAATAAA